MNYPLERINDLELSQVLKVQKLKLGKDMLR